MALGPDANTNALPATSDLQVGDLVFGFAWRTREEKAYQTLVLAERWQVGKVPDGWGANRLQELVTIPNNFVTGWHTLVTDLNLPLPWPKPQGYHPASSEAKRILIWGGSSSVGQFTLQILRYYGYDSVVATASSRNLDLVKKAGAKEVVDYRSPGWQQDVTRALGGDVELVLDCIGSLDGSVRPIATLVGEGAVVAVLLPVVVKDAGEKGGPVYAMSATENVEWKAGVEVKGVRTHFYADVSDSHPCFRFPFSCSRLLILSFLPFPSGGLGCWVRETDRMDGSMTSISNIYSLSSCLPWSSGV